MAEAAGLVIGGVALLGLFDSCMNMLRTIESGRNFQEDYQSAVLKVVMLSHRLARWERTYRATATNSTAQDGKTAKFALEEIYRLLQAARDAGEPYLPRDAKSGGSTAIAKVTDNMKALALRKKQTGRNDAPFAAAGSWALLGKDRMDEIIRNLDFFVTNLEKISPATAITTRQGAIHNEALELIQPGAIEEPETALPIIQDAAAAVDPELGREIKSRGHQFKNFKIGDQAVSIQGNYVAQGATVTGYGSNYSDITVSGTAKSFSGDMYGGENPAKGW